MSCRFLPIVIAIALVPQSRPSFAQTKSVAEALGKLTSRTDTVRFNALADLRSAATAGHIELCSPRAAEWVKSGLLRALAAENALVFGPPDPSVELGEGDGDFQAELIGCVGSLHDPRAAHELAAALDTGGGAVGALLGLGGDAAANEIVAILGSPKGRLGQRMDAAELAGQLTAPSTHTPVSAENRARLRTALLASLADHSGMVRSSAIFGLRSFVDDDVRAAIVRIAQSDTGTITVAGSASMAPHQPRENGSGSTAPPNLVFRRRCNGWLSSNADEWHTVSNAHRKHASNSSSGRHNKDRSRTYPSSAPTHSAGPTCDPDLAYQNSR